MCVSQCVTHADRLAHADRKGLHVGIERQRYACPLFRVLLLVSSTYGDGGWSAVHAHRHIGQRPRTRTVGTQSTHRATLSLDRRKTTTEHDLEGGLHQIWKPSHEGTIDPWAHQAASFWTRGTPASEHDFGVGSFQTGCIARGDNRAFGLIKRRRSWGTYAYEHAYTAARCGPVERNIKRASNR